MSKLLFALVALAALPAMMMAGPGVGQPAPDFTLPDSAGVNHSLYDYAGKVVPIIFWQST